MKVFILKCTLSNLFSTGVPYYMYFNNSTHFINCIHVHCAYVSFFLYVFWKFDSGKVNQKIISNFYEAFRPGLPLYFPRRPCISILPSSVSKFVKCIANKCTWPNSFKCWLSKRNYVNISNIISDRILFHILGIKTSSKQVFFYIKICFLVFFNRENRYMSQKVI